MRRRRFHPQGTVLATLVVAWIAGQTHGVAQDPQDAGSIPPPQIAPAAGSPGQPANDAKARDWWAFQPLRKPSPPARPAASAIDAFLDEAIDAANLEASPEADRPAWLRRATFDLTGLPPTPADLGRFLADTTPGAFERVVDRLLASPAHGEHWARQWLDVVRYADYHDADPAARNANCEPLEAWRYRDWVVGALNHDLPYGRFVGLQVAGDLEGDPMSAIATGFLVNGSWDRGDADKEKLVSDMVDDQIDTIGKAFLGLTLGCARCHDHKTDPVSTRDYYALAGMFYSTRILEELGTKGGEITLRRIPLVPAEVAAERDRHVARLEVLKGRLAALDRLRPPLATNHPSRLELLTERRALEASMPPAYPTALSAAEGGMPGGLFPNLQDVPVHVRGSYTRLGPVVSRGLPAFFAGADHRPVPKGSGRQELAAWLSSADNPLTARVLVNRVWQGHFGAGLAPTPNHLGLGSEPPSHPALLDWLAAAFLEDGGSIKALHRRIMTSAAYRRSAAVTPAQAEVDPANRWLARFPRRRLPAESIRDALQEVSGGLDRFPGGPAAADLSVPRRSLYVQTARWDRGTFAALFDAANPDASVDRRDVSTVAPQALFLLNHPFVAQRAGALAERTSREAGPNPGARIRWLHRALFAREIRPAEMVVALDLLARLGGTDAGHAWRDYVHVLLCSNEFIHLD